MIIPQKKIMFVHIPKCAGSSIAAGLFNLIGMNFRTYQRTKNKNYYFIQDSMKHAKATVYRDKLGDDFDSYYKFSLIRHPRERFISALNWQHENAPGKHKLPVKELIRNWTDDQLEKIVKNRLFTPMVDYVLDENGDLLVDDVFDIRFIDQVRETLELKRINKKIRHNDKFHNFFDSKEDQDRIDYIVNLIYKKDMEYFGYEN